MESAFLPVDALDEPLLLRHQESEDSLLDLGEERDGLLEVGRVLLELLLQQVPERLVHNLLHLGLERGRLLLRLQILSKLVQLDRLHCMYTVSLICLTRGSSRGFSHLNSTKSGV